MTGNLPPRVTKSTGRDPALSALRPKSARAYKLKMSRATIVILFLLAVPRLADARASGTEMPVRHMLICGNHIRSTGERGCIDEPRPQKEFGKNAKRFLRASVMLGDANAIATAPIIALTDTRSYRSLCRRRSSTDRAV
jgi:hypothetical protein